MKQYYTISFYPNSSNRAWCFHNKRKNGMTSVNATIRIYVSKGKYFIKVDEQELKINIEEVSHLKWEEIENKSRISYYRNNQYDRQMLSIVDNIKDVITLLSQLDNYID